MIRSPVYGIGSDRCQSLLLFIKHDVYEDFDGRQANHTTHVITNLFGTIANDRFILSIS